jgi:hypothetical protein
MPFFLITPRAAPKSNLRFFPVDSSGGALVLVNNGIGGVTISGGLLLLRTLIWGGSDVKGHSRLLSPVSGESSSMGEGERDRWFQLVAESYISVLEPNFSTDDEALA